MNKDDIIRIAREAGMVVYEGGQDRVLFDGSIVDALTRFAELVVADYQERTKWDGIHTCHSECQRPVCVSIRKAVATEREKVAKWMIERSYATGHGDTIEDLLAELDWQIADGWNRALVEGSEVEREQCAKLLDEMAAEDRLSNYYKVAALRIRERGAP